VVGTETGEEGREGVVAFELELGIGNPLLLLALTLASDGTGIDPCDSFSSSLPGDTIVASGVVEGKRLRDLAAEGELPVAFPKEAFFSFSAWLLLRLAFTSSSMVIGRSSVLSPFSGVSASAVSLFRVFSRASDGVT
jgi:hypothetical protein